MNKLHIKFEIAAIISLFICHLALICYAQDAAISIASRIPEQSPEIIIRSPFDFEKEISLKVKPDPRYLPSDAFIKMISELGMCDAKGVSITSGFDIDLQNEIVLAYSGGSSQIIKASFRIDY